VTSLLLFLTVLNRREFSRRLHCSATTLKFDYVNGMVSYKFTAALKLQASLYDIVSPRTNGAGKQRGLLCELHCYICKKIYNIRYYTVK